MTTTWMIYVAGPVLGAIIAVGFEWVLKGKTIAAGFRATRWLARAAQRRSFAARTARIFSLRNLRTRAAASAGESELRAAAMSVA